MGVAVLHAFHVVINGDGDHLGLPGNVSTNHQYNAELSNGVSETEYRSSQESSFGHG